jgi:hypothetical protein
LNYNNIKIILKMKINICESDLEIESADSSEVSSYHKTSGTWYLVQGLGDTNTKGITESDKISTLQFDKEGRFLSVGDNGGRVIIFAFKEHGDEDSVASNGRVFPCLQYLTEF